MKSGTPASARKSHQVEGHQSPARLPDPLPRFLTVAEVALLLRVSKRTVYDWVSQRKIPHRKAGDRIIKAVSPVFFRRRGVREQLDAL